MVADVINPFCDELTDQELLRYSRQIMMPEMDVAGQLALKNARVLIVGMGGLGSPVALYLASAGVGHLTLVDFDFVDESNLQRQIIHSLDTLGDSKVLSAKRRIRRLNENCDVTTIEERLDEAGLSTLISQVDIIVDASDNFETRFMVNRQVKAACKVLVSGAAIRMEGQVSVFDFRDTNNPCYACLYQDVGEEQMTCSENGVVAPLVGIIGSIQAMEVIKVATGMGKPLIGRLMILDAMSMDWRTMKYSRDPHCEVCRCSGLSE